MKAPKVQAAPPPTPIADPVSVTKAKKKDVARQLASAGGRASTILTEPSAKLGA
jgi:hypothetical protein